MNKKYKDLLKDIFIFSIGSIGSKLILFLMVPIYTNYLTEAEYGISDLVFTVSQLVVPFVSLVIFDAVLRFGISKENRPQDVLLVGLVVCSVGSVATFVLTPLLSLYNTLSHWKWYVSIYIILNMFSSVLTNYLKSIGKNKLYAVINIIQTFTLAILNVVLLTFCRIGIVGYLISVIASSGITIILSVVFGRIIQDLRTARFVKLLFKDMVVYSAPLIINNISWWVIHSANKIMIEFMIGATALGIYTVATKIPSLINVVISIFSQAWHLSSSKEIEGDKDINFYSSVFSYYTVLTFAAAIFLTGIIKPFINIYVGDSFIDSWKYIPLLLTGAVFSSVSSYFGTLYGALKKSVNSMISTLIAAIINIVVGIILIKYFQLWGAVVATLLSYIVLSIFRMYDIKRFLNIRINYLKYYINCALVLMQSVLVSLDFYIYIVSIIVILLYCIINIKTISDLFRNIFKQLRFK